VRKKKPQSAERMAQSEERKKMMELLGIKVNSSQVK